MTKREQLTDLVKAYKSNQNDASLNAITDFLNAEELFFDKYHLDANGESSVSYACYTKGNGRFYNLAPATTNYPTPDLVEIKKADGEIVYVSIYNISFDESDIVLINSILLNLPTP